MRSRIAAIALLLGVAPSLMAQRNVGNIDHRFSFFLEGNTVTGSGAGGLDNAGLGASLDLHALPNLSVRLTGAYDRVTPGLDTPFQFLTASGDAVFYPVTYTLLRPYVFAGVGYSWRAARTDVARSLNGVVTSVSQSAAAYVGPEFGGGVEMGGLFMQYRTAPISSNSIHYNLISLGFRF